MCDTGSIMANEMDNQIEAGRALNDELERLQGNIDSCNGDTFLMYGPVKALEEFKKKHNIKE